MQFSIRTLLIACVIVAIPFGAIGIYNSMWEAHCRRLETSLLQKVLQDVVNHTEQKFGYKNQDYDSSEVCWTTVAGNAVPSWEARFGDHVYYIQNIRWVDWETVNIDRGSYHPGFYSGWVKDQKLKYIDRKWQVVELGTLIADTPSFPLNGGNF